MTHFQCPRCHKEIIILEVNSRNFKYKVVCGSCCYYDWVDSLEELKKDEKDS